MFAYPSLAGIFHFYFVAYLVGLSADATTPTVALEDNGNDIEMTPEPPGRDHRLATSSDAPVLTLEAQLELTRREQFDQEFDAVREHPGYTVTTVKFTATLNPWTFA